MLAATSLTLAVSSFRAPSLFLCRAPSIAFIDCKYHLLQIRQLCLDLYDSREAGCLLTYPSKTTTNSERRSVRLSREVHWNGGRSRPVSSQLFGESRQNQGGCLHATLHNWTGPGTSDTFWSVSTGQPVYTLFSANYDAQCIAFATISWPGMSNHYGWVGDWGSECAGDDRSIHMVL